MSTRNRFGNIFILTLFWVSLISLITCFDSKASGSENPTQTPDARTASPTPQPTSTVTAGDFNPYERKNSVSPTAVASPVKKKTDDLDKDVLRISLSSYPLVPLLQKDTKEGVYTIDVEEGLLRVSFDDLIPGISYSPLYRLIEKEPQITFPKQLDSEKGHYSAPNEALKKLKETIVAIWESDDEMKVATNVQALRKLLCIDQYDAQTVQLANETIERTRWDQVIEKEIKPGSKLEVTLQRDGQKAVFIFTGPELPRFFQTYGFCYLQDGNELYFTKKNSDEKYIIQSKSNRHELTPSGLLLINYRLFGPLENVADMSVCLAGALSFDGEKPSVGMGLNFVLASNLGLVVGMAVAQENRLRGEYETGKNGTILDQALEPDQLVESVCDETFFFGLSLNLSSNPFKKDDKAKTKSTK